MNTHSKRAEMRRLPVQTNMEASGHLCSHGHRPKLLVVVSCISVHVVIAAFVLSSEEPVAWHKIIKGGMDFFQIPMEKLGLDKDSPPVPASPANIKKL